MSKSKTSGMSFNGLKHHFNCSPAVKPTKVTSKQRELSGCGLKARKAQRNRVCVTVFVLGEQRPKPASKRCLSANTKVCFGGVLGVRGLAEQVRLQVNPLQDILRHAQNRIHGLDLFVSEKRETSNSEQSVERIHLNAEKDGVKEYHRDTALKTGVVMTHTHVSEHLSTAFRDARI